MNNKNMFLFLLVAVALIGLPVISTFQGQSYDNIGESPLFSIRTKQVNNERVNTTREFEVGNESSIPFPQRPKYVAGLLRPPTVCPETCTCGWGVSW